LAPLPDEPEVVEGDEDVEQEDPTHSVPPEATSRDTSEPILPKELPSKVPSPKPHPLSISFAPDLAPPEQADDDDGLSGALQGLEEELAGQVDVGVGVGVGVGVDVADPLGATDLVDLDLSQLGPDGTTFGDATDLTQLQPADGILGTDMVLDTGIPDDPFTIQPS
jgi:hypothetical protein